MAIPVDGILVRGSGVTVDESAMTGESDELKKEPLSVCKYRLEEHLAEEESEGKMDRNSHSVPSPLMLSGTQIQTGEGWFMVIVVGKNSCQGKIMESLE